MHSLPGIADVSAHGFLMHSHPSVRTGPVMVDIKKCPGCKSNTSLSNTTCPYCGYRFDAGPAQVTEPAAKQSRCPNCDTPVSPNRSICPTCKMVLKEKRGMGTYLLIGGFILAAVLLAVFVFQIPGTPSVALECHPGICCYRCTDSAVMQHRHHRPETANEHDTAPAHGHDLRPGRCKRTPGHGKRDACRNSSVQAGFQRDVSRAQSFRYRLLSWQSSAAGTKRSCLILCMRKGSVVPSYPT